MTLFLSRTSKSFVAHAKVVIFCVIQMHAITRNKGRQGVFAKEARQQARHERRAIHLQNLNSMTFNLLSLHNPIRLSVFVTIMSAYLCIFIAHYAYYRLTTLQFVELLVFIEISDMYKEYLRLGPFPATERYAQLIDVVPGFFFKSLTVNLDSK